MTSNAEKELFNSINLKFTSGNKIPVSQAVITKEEWESVKEIIEIKTNNFLKLKDSCKFLMSIVDNYNWVGTIPKEDLILLAITWGTYEEDLKIQKRVLDIKNNLKKGV
jgi:hypothetical protein